ncbi:hypothetical protein ABIA39_006194 [Nocardia sp. GAS34]|uniref:DUF1254 domain-containing protein n=1 Tax=unclassified Nocardia TaxID=2637762 RepID=UPI003D1B7186
MTDQELIQRAAQAYVYGFPLVFDVEQVDRFVRTGLGANPPAPFNTFGHTPGLAEPSDTFVTVNNDTLYSIAQIDLGVGPIVLRVPASDRYYVLQFVDAWTNNFAYIGTRGTGNDAGTYLLVPPGWAGTAPDGMTPVRFPTRVASIVGRYAVAGPQDLPAAKALQDALTLEPLEPGRVPVGVPEIAADASAALTFFEKFRTWSQEFLPAARDLPVLRTFAALGLTGEVPVADLAEPVRAALGAGYEAGREMLEQLVRGSAADVVNGWVQSFHIFDYNLDFFEIGTRDEPQWKMAEGPVRFATRAAAALGGLWGNHGYEAAYSPIYLDDKGEQLTGERTYTLRLDPTPPNAGFWSLTMYDVPDYYLVENPIGRYSIGDRTPGIVFDTHGALTVTIGHTEPEDPVARANWLPCPAGPFRPLLRVYIPDPQVLDGRYVPAPIERRA